MGKMSRTKGARGERELLRKLGEELGVMLQRNLVQTREGGADCIQIQGWAVEVKRTERLQRPSWWRQACEQADRLGVQPIVFYRRSRSSWRALVPVSGGYSDVEWLEGVSVIREKWMAWP